jgi:MFS family permease
MIPKTLQLYKFSAYGFLKNLRFFDAFILLFFRQQGITFLQIGTLISIREVSITILEIPTGLIADCYGRRNSMIFSFLSYILSFFIFFFFPKFGFYAIAMILFGMGEAFRSGTHKAMILEYLKQKNITHLKVEYYGFTRSWSQIGSALAALIAGAIIIYSGEYRFIFLGSIIPYFFALFLMISYPKELDGFIEKKKHPNLIKEIIINIGNTTPKLRKALFNSTLYDGLFKTVKDYIQPILKAFALSTPIFLFFKDKRDTIIIAIVYFLLFLLTSFASRNAQKFKNKFRSLASAINWSFAIGLIFVLLAGFFFFQNLFLLTIICFILLYIFQNIRRPLNVAFISEIIPSRIMASGLSAESQMKTIIIAVFSPLMGLLADKFGIGIALIILTSLTLLVFPLIKVTEKKSSL